ncbi:Zc3h6 [Symbiodinium natans]|uniref:Zc3h6 protein n=1 Tax=Symbiodinium natans TaxID=878477 RepID=A0A812QDU0_9DINO|nr:Zc3h6 [Symbiodinium natans]
MRLRPRPGDAGLCWHFNTPSGCRNGEDCLFRHEAMQPLKFFQHEDANAAPGLRRGQARRAPSDLVEEPRSARSILHRYSASSIAKAAGQEVRIKGRPPPSAAGPSAPQWPASEEQHYAEEEEEEEEEEEFESDVLVAAVDAELPDASCIDSVATTDPYL